MPSPFRVPPHVVTREIGGEIVLLDLDRGTYYSLNSTGTRYWTLAAQGLEHEAIVDSIAASYKVSREVVAADLNELAAALEAAGLAIPDENGLNLSR